MKIKTKTKDCHLLVKVKLARNEQRIDGEFQQFSDVMIRGLMRPTIESQKEILYTGPVGIPLSERLRAPITKKEFLLILEQLVVVTQKILSCKLSLSNLLLDSNYIYINDLTKELQFIYLPYPVNGINFAGAVANCIDSVLYSARPQPERDMEYITRFVYFLQGLPAFYVLALEEFVKREDPGVITAIRRQYTGQSGFMTNKKQTYYEHYDAKEENVEEATGLMVEEAEEATGLMADAFAVPFAEEATGLMEESFAAPFAEEATGLMEEAFAAPVAEEAAGLMEDTFAAPVEWEATGLLEETVVPGEETAMGLLEETDAVPTGWNDVGLMDAAAPAEEAVAGFMGADNTGLIVEDDRNSNMGLHEGNKGNEIPNDGFSGNYAPVYGQYYPPENMGYGSDDGLLDDATGLLIEEEEDYGATTLLDEDEPTCRMPTAYITRKFNQDRVLINKPVFRIGKGENYSDFCIRNDKVSRKHADIVNRGYQYYIIDLNSTNGTYLNGRRIPAQVEVDLRDGDLIRLANEEFVFTIV